MFSNPFLSAVVSVSALLATSGGADRPVITGDLGRIQGNWEAQAGPRGEYRVQLAIHGHKVLARIESLLGLRIEAHGIVEIDESTTPRSLDWRNIELADGQPLPTLRGVYLLESHSLTIRNGSFAGTRPKNFEPGDSVVASRVTFRRPTKATSAASSALGGERTRR